MVDAQAYGNDDGMVLGSIPKRCVAELGNILADSECQQLLLAKMMGYLLILGSLSVKAPQIAKILYSKSVAGLSPSSFYSELVIYIINGVYHIVKGSPISAYGEILTIGVQIIYMVFLLWLYMDHRPSPLGMTAWVTFFVGLAAGCAALPHEYLLLLPLMNVPLLVVSKVPQILTNFANGHTGQLAAVTVVLNFVGASMRIFTTIQEVGWDTGLIATHGLASFLNGLIVLQILVYWKRTAQWAKEQAKDAKQKKDA